MKEREIKQESTISKEIIDSLTSPTQIPPNILKIPSAPNLISKSLSIMLLEEEKSSQEKDSDSNREYKIGNYMVKYTLGQGTFGKVKLGIYIPNNEKVAIKILEKNRIVEKDDEIRVKREFDMLAQFSHPNVILVAEIFESEDSYYSVMEFCEGGELFNYIVKKNRLSEDESAFFFYQLINGLEYIHSLGIVHRDLKPENLLLTSDHILKIIDFGLSNYFKTGQKNLLSTPCGSPCYASPEMVAGKKYDGFKIDIWSCGIVLYAMLCGYLPFEDPDNEVLFKKILECKLDFPGYVNKLSIDLIEKILVTDPEKRITIPDIKMHPFYLKGKAIFEEGFSINQIMQNPIEKNMSEKKIETSDNNKEEKQKEKTIEEISVDINSDNNDNNINNNKKIIEIDINDFKRDNMADIGIKKDNDTINSKDINKTYNNERNKRLEKRENINKKKRKFKNKENIRNNDNNNNLDNKDKNNTTNRNEKKQKALNIKISLDNNLKKDEGAYKNFNKNVISTEQENIYMPLKTEYNNINLRFNTLENVKDINENKNEKLNLTKKINNNDLIKSKEKNLKKYFELKSIEKHKEKSKSKSKPKNRERSIDQSKEKTEDKRKNKKTLTPKKIFYISKKVKSQRPSDIKNLSKRVNINLKINPKKYLQQKYQHLEKLISAKEPKKIKTNFGNKNININNKYTNYTPSQIKGILNTFNSKNKKLNEDLNEKYFERLKTETNNINLKNKNSANKNNFINNTIDSIKYKFGYTISDIKKDVIKNRIKKTDLFTINLREKKKLNDIRRIKSSTFNNENNGINLNNKTFQVKMQAHPVKKIQMVRNKPNELIYSVNNFSNNKSPFNINIMENNNINNNILRTEPTSDISTKILNIPEKGPIPTPKTNFKILRKTNTNLRSLGYNNKNINPAKSNLHYRRSYLKYLNNIRKAPTYNLLKTVNLKNLPLTSKQRKNPYQIVKNNENSLGKKNQQVTIRNTVINFNMIDTGIILPSVKNLKNGKKINSIYNTNTNNSISLKPNKKFSKDITSLNAMNTINNFGNYHSINPLNQENKYNNTINKFSNINTETNKINSLSSFNKLVNKMKNKQKLNKIHFNNLNNNNNNNIKFNDNLNKIHNKFRSMKLNDYFKTSKIDKKNLEISGINNNNTVINSSNNAIISMNNGIKNINDDKNFTLNSFMNRNKKYFIPKGKGYLIKQTGKINKLINNYKRRNNLSGNNNSNNLSENFKQLSIKGINNS